MTIMQTGALRRSGDTYQTSTGTTFINLPAEPRVL